MTFTEGSTELLAHLRLGGYSPETIRCYWDQLKCFGKWLAMKRIADLRTVTHARILDYQAYVRSEPIGPESQALRIRAVKRLYGYLVTQSQLLLDPTEGIQEISRRHKLPRPVLTNGEMKRLLAVPDVSGPFGIRNRALLELLYATGVRVGELRHVCDHDVDLQQETMQLRHTKNGTPRVVPLGKNATHWLRLYLEQVRPHLVRKRPFEHALFVTRSGHTMRRPIVRWLLNQCRVTAKIRKAVSPHLMRHSCATHLLQAGADVRTIQELLGHRCLSSTVVYTRVAPMDVKAMHERYHPGSLHVAH